MYRIHHQYRHSSSEVRLTYSKRGKSGIFGRPMKSQHFFAVFRGYFQSYPSGANERRKGEAASFCTLFVDKCDVGEQTVGGVSANKQSLSLKLQKTIAISNSHEGH